MGPGAVSERNRRKNLSVDLYAQSLLSLMRAEYLVLDTRKRTEDDSPLGYETLARRGIVATVWVMITDISHRSIGYVGFDFHSSPDEARLGECVKFAQNIAAELGVLLSVKEMEG